MKSVQELIIRDIDEEFEKIRINLKIHLSKDTSLNKSKEFLSNYIPSEVLASSEVLLDTTINYLMDEARTALKQADAQMQNKFFDAEFRKKIKDWSVRLENKLSIDPDVLKYSTDPRLKQGLIAGGITFLTGTAITSVAFPPTMIIGAILSGIVTIILSIIAFKVAFNLATPKAFKQMQLDIDNYLEKSKKQITDWLVSVSTNFEKDFNSFCKENGWEV